MQRHWRKRYLVRNAGQDHEGLISGFIDDQTPAGDFAMRVRSSGSLKVQGNWRI